MDQTRRFGVAGPDLTGPGPFGRVQVHEQDGPEPVDPNLEPCLNFGWMGTGMVSIDYGSRSSVNASKRSPDRALLIDELDAMVRTCAQPSTGL